MTVGLRIDVDTFRGTRHGVPALCDQLGRHGIRASFFFCVGPDNMGRHVTRLLRPSFFWKMLRGRAASLYGFDILFRGTLGPGPRIGERLAPVIRRAADDGHEIGLHAWDHHAWQTQIGSMNRDAIERHLRAGVDAITEILRRPPIASAAPAWRCTDEALFAKEWFPFVYNSDCRGERPFLPVVAGRTLSQPQIPTTLPTYDEVIGRDGITDDNYNEFVFGLLGRRKLDVLTIHAEVEGIARAGLFERFLETARARGVEFVPLGSILAASLPLERAVMVLGEIPGREGWGSWQGTRVDA